MSAVSFTSSAEATSTLTPGACVAIGNFDGVHLGHQELLKTTIALSQKNHIIPTVLTFDPHPAKLLAPAMSPLLIATKEQKIKLLESQKIKIIVLQKFDLELAKLSAEDFFTTHLVKNLNAKAIVVGHDFTFGHRRSGNIDTLAQLAKQHSMALTIVPAVMAGETLVSSSLIRKLINDGRVAEASHFLGHPETLQGTIEHGHKRGTALGIHTANLAVENELLPADGVYVTRAVIDGKTWPSVTNIGKNPTFDNQKRSIEAHLLDFSGDLYGKRMELQFVERLRDEIRFATPAALVKQIEQDIAAARALLK